MTLAQLIARFRVDADDAISQAYLWSDAAVTAWLNDAVNEACIRARLLHESSNASICQIPVSAGVSSYQLSPFIYELDYIAFKLPGQSTRTPIYLTSREDLDVGIPGWRDMVGEVKCAIQGDRSIRLAPTPSAAGVLHIEGFRLPLADMILGADSPEINAVHHIYLVHWALYRAFSVPDSEAVDPNRAALAEREFTSHFGQRPDADLRRMTRQDAAHHNAVFWP